jgi:hypothetical protein
MSASSAISTSFYFLNLAIFADMKEFIPTFKNPTLSGQNPNQHKKPFL